MKGTRNRSQDRKKPGSNRSIARSKDKSVNVKKRTKVEKNTKDIIEKLLGVRGSKPGKEVRIAEKKLFDLCREVLIIFKDQPMLLELEGPLKVVGDIHGQFHDLLRIFLFNQFPPDSNYLFLGDYVDRGRQSIETITLLFAYKVMYPYNFFLLRGNHESGTINKLYGFYEECKKRYSTKLWKEFCHVFDHLPVAAIVDDKIFCVHGGISQNLRFPEQIELLKRPLDVPDKGLLCDLLWSDPCRQTDKWGHNNRGVSYVFGKKPLSVFLKDNQFDLLVRAHQVVEDGYEFFAKKKLVTVFSAPNYCGEFDNAGGIMTIDDKLMCSFHILKPDPKGSLIDNTAQMNTSNKNDSKKRRSYVNNEVQSSNTANNELNSSSKTRKHNTLSKSDRTDRSSSSNNLNSSYKKHSNEKKS